MELPVHQMKPQEHEIDLIEIITILWKSKKFIISTTLIFIFIGFFYILFTTPMYRSTITLYPAIDTGVNSPMTAMARQLGVGGIATGTGNYNIPDVAKSRTLSEKIITQLWDIEESQQRINLIDYFESKWKIDDDVRTDLEKLYYYSEYFSKERISAFEDKNTGLVKINVDMEDPKLSSDIANYISFFVTNWVNESQKDQIKRNLNFTIERSDVLYKELKEAENELKKFRESNRNIINSPDLQLELQRLQRDVTIKQEVYLTLVKQKEISQIEANKSLDVIRILDNAIPNNKPIKPRKIFSIFISTILGLFLSSVFVFSLYLKEKLQNND